MCGGPIPQIVTLSAQRSGIVIVRAPASVFAGSLPVDGAACPENCFDPQAQFEQSVRTELWFRLPQED